MQHEVSGTDGRYRVGADGSVWGTGRWGSTWRPLAQGTLRNGYKKVSIAFGDKKRTMLVHRIVATAFHGEPSGRHVNHIDGNKTNNRPENLEWVTPRENQRHAFANGLHKISEAVRASGRRNIVHAYSARKIVSAEERQEIIRRHADGEKSGSIARDLGWGRATITKIVGKSKGEA